MAQIFSAILTTQKRLYHMLLEASQGDTFLYISEV